MLPLIYFAIGLIYVLINVYIRKIEEQDPWLVILWWFMWPLFFLLIIGVWIYNKTKKEEIV